MRSIKWFIINGIFAYVIYAGYILKIEGAENLALFFAWVNIFLSFFCLSDEVTKKIKERGRSVPAWLNITYDIGIVSVFAWYGAWITGAFWVIHIFFLEIAYQKAEVN